MQISLYTTKTIGIAETTHRGEIEVEIYSACEPNDGETSSSSAKKLKLNITDLDEQKAMLIIVNAMY